MDPSIWPTIEGIQHWFYENCDGDWEHSFGLQITTMDNPGWDVKIDIRETVLEGLEIFEEFEGARTERDLLPANAYDANYDWYRIWIEQSMFRAYCAPKRLGFVLDIFLRYAKEAEDRLGSLYPKD